MTVTVRQLANLVRGNVLGDGTVVICSARALADAETGDITLLDDVDQEAELQQSEACAAVVSARLPTCTKALIQVDDPQLAFAAILRHFQATEPPEPTGIDPRAVVHASVRIGADPSVDRFAVIGENTVVGRRCQVHAGVTIGKNCRLGDDVVLHPSVVLYDDTVIGDRVTIRARAAIGTDGFGYRFRDGRHVKVPQLGHVDIGNDVDIGAGASIDRGTFGATRIGAGTKIGNQTQIAHNCQIGQHNIIGSQIGIGGSSTTGDRVLMGDRAGVKDHMNIGDDTVLAPGTGVIQPVPPGASMVWYPALEQQDADEILPLFRELPGMQEELARLLERLALSDA